MIVSHKYKFVFIKTKKTAGSSIEKVLNRILGPEDICTGSVQDATPRMNCKADLKGHIGYERIMDLFGKRITDDYFWWCVERNSYEKCLSDWWFHKTVLGRDRTTFDQHILSGTVSDWDLYFHKGKFRAQVIQYDQLHFMWRNLVIRMGIPPVSIKTTRVKQSRGKPAFAEIANMSTQMNIKERMHREIDYFGYNVPKGVGVGV